MSYELQGTVTRINETQSFGANGFQVRDFVIKVVEGEYENDYCLQFTGDKVDRLDNIQIDQVVEVKFNIRCRYHGDSDRYFTSLNAWFVKRVDNGGADQPPASEPQGQYPAPAPQVPSATSEGSYETESEEEIPF